MLFVLHSIYGLDIWPRYMASIYDLSHEHSAFNPSLRIWIYLTYDTANRKLVGERKAAMMMPANKLLDDVLLVHMLYKEYFPSPTSKSK